MAISQIFSGNDFVTTHEVIEFSEQSLMILDKEGSVLTRMWCLGEACHSGKKGKGPCEGSLKLLAYGVNWKELEKVFIDLDVSRAQATVIDDRDRILQDIEKDILTMLLSPQMIIIMMKLIPGLQLWWSKEWCFAMLQGSVCGMEDCQAPYMRDYEGSLKVLGPDHPSSCN